MVEAAELLGLIPAALRTWRSRQWRSREVVATGVKPGRSSEDSKELATASRRIPDLEEEVAVPRKATAPQADRQATRAASGRPHAHRNSGGGSVDTGTTFGLKCNARTRILQHRPGAPAPDKA
ncbi:hypothetical protein [Segniliparus rotundus]|uniref:hypothetical protein n=1 Tax=Segniliparus rotundus TaxID=286802 RepID=UPI0006740211